MANTVDEESWCSTHATLYTTVNLFSYMFNNGRVSHISQESSLVETEGHRIA